MALYKRIAYEIEAKYFDGSDDAFLDLVEWCRPHEISRNVYGTSGMHEEIHHWQYYHINTDPKAFLKKSAYWGAPFWVLKNSLGLWFMDDEKFKREYEEVSEYREDV